MNPYDPDNDPYKPARLYLLLIVILIVLAMTQGCSAIGVKAAGVWVGTTTRAGALR